MTSSNNSQSSFLISKDNETLSESQMEKKLLTRQELFSNEPNFNEIKEQAMSSDLSLGNNERDKLFRNKRLKQRNKISNTISLINTISIPKELYTRCSTIEANLGQIEEFITKLKSDNASFQYEGICGLRKLLSFPSNPPIQEMIDYGLVSIFIAFLDHPYPEFQFEALWCLVNISSGTFDQSQIIAVKGGLGKIIKLMDSTVEEILEQSIWAIGNLAGDSARVREQIFELKGFDKIVLILSTTEKSSIIKRCVWAIANFCRVKPACPYEILKKVICIVVKAIYTLPSEIELLVDASFFLSYLTENYKKSIDEIISTGVLPTIIKSLTTDNVYIQLSCLRIIGNIATGNANQTQMLLDENLLKFIKSTMINPKKSIRKETAWIISNIAAGTQRQIETLIVEEYLPLLLEVVNRDEPEIQKEAIWAVCNLTSIEKKELMELLINQNIVEVICSCLKMKEPKYLAVSLEALSNILAFGKKHYFQNGINLMVAKVEELGMIDVLESLQYHAVEIIYEKTVKLLETYFDTENVQ